MKSHSWEQINLLGSHVPAKGLDERNVYNIDFDVQTNNRQKREMILTYSGQFRQLSLINKLVSMTKTVDFLQVSRLK